MSDVVNKITVLPQFSVNTPDFPEADWLINPAGLPGLISGNVPQRYWKISGLDVVEMTQPEKDAVDAAALPGQKAAKISALGAQAQTFVVAEGYDDSAKMYLNGLLTDAYASSLTNRAAYITSFLSWVNDVQMAYAAAKAACNAAANKAALDAVVLDLTPFVATNPDVTPEGALAIPD